MKTKLLVNLFLSIVLTTGCGKDENPPQTPKENVTSSPVSQEKEAPSLTPQEKVIPPSVSQDAEVPPTATSKNAAPPSLPEPDAPPLPPKVSKIPQQIPEGAVTMFAEGLAEINKEKYMAVIHGEPHIQKVAEITFDRSAAMKEYEKAFIKAYGLEGWKELALVDFNVDTEALHRKLESMQIEIEGDKAVCTVPGDEKPVLLIRKDGLWYVDVSAMSHYGPKQADQLIQIWTKQIDLIREMQKKVGQPEVTVLDLHRELSQRWMLIKDN